MTFGSMVSGTCYTPLSEKVLKKLEEMASGKIEHRGRLGGHQYIVPFANGFHASIIKHDGSYGRERDLFEIAVLDESKNLTYTTPITDDVIGYLSEEEALEICKKISELEKGAYYDWDSAYKD